MNEQQKPVKTPLEWIRFAEGDFRVAESNFESDEPSYHTICFLCQGAAEKFLKAYLISQGWELEKTHDIIELLKACKTYKPDLSDMTQLGDVLNEYVIARRYPGDLKSDEIGKAEAEEAIEATRAIRMRVMELMAKPNDLSS